VKGGNPEGAARSWRNSHRSSGTGKPRSPTRVRGCHRRRFGGSSQPNVSVWSDYRGNSRLKEVEQENAGQQQSYRDEFREAAHPDRSQTGIRA
jgi:hypothetical protein